MANGTPSAIPVSLSRRCPNGVNMAFSALPSICKAAVRTATATASSSRGSTQPLMLRVICGALVQMAASDRLRWHAELAEVVDGQAEGVSGVVRGSPLRPRSHHPVRALVSSVQAEPARSGGDDGRARPVDGAYDDYALGAALRTGVRETLETDCPGGRPVVAGRRDIRQNTREGGRFG